MSLSQNVQRSSALLILSLALTACGGGGGSSDPNFTAEKPIPITEANAPEVVAEASDSSVGSGLDSPLSAAFRSSAAGASTEGHADLLRGTVKSLVESSTTRFASAARTVNSSETTDCAIRGTIKFTFSGDVNDNTGNGTFGGSIDADDCSDSPGESIDGKFSISGDLEEGELDETLTAEFDGFTVRTADGSGSINGKMLVTIRATASYDEFRMVSRDCAFSFSANGQRVTIGEFSFVVKDYTTYIDEAMNFTANSGRLGGSFRFETVQNFLTDISQEYPYEGQAIITGENNGKIRITSLGGNPSDTVTVDIDADGDGSYEAAITPSPTWAEIDD